METSELNPRHTPTGNGPATARRARTRFDPTQLFAQRDRLPWFWFFVAKLQVLGCNISRDILANIETQRSPVTDIQIVFLAEVLSIAVADLFPPKRHISGSQTGRR